MAIKQEEIDKAHEILRQFEKKEIDHSEFSWKYVTDRVKASKTSLWRNEEFKEHFERIQKLMKVYAKKKKAFDHGLIKQSHDETEISKLKQKIEDLQTQLDRERERLAYAALIARQKGFDPSVFMDSAPLNPGIVERS